MKCVKSFCNQHQSDVHKPDILDYDPWLFDVASCHGTTQINLNYYESEISYYKHKLTVM